MADSFHQTTVYMWDISSLSEEVWRKLTTLCSDARRQKAERYRRQEDRQRSIGAEILLRFSVKDLNFTQEFEFVYGPDGKPFFTSGVPEFSLSHSGKWVVCALSDRPVGCDVEQVRPLWENVAKRFFTEAEYRQICSAPKAEQADLFYRFWTLKESYMKYTGQGLSLPPNSFQITFGEHIGIIPEDNCVFVEHRQNGYHFAVCSKNRNVEWYRCTLLPKADNIEFSKERVDD